MASEADRKWRMVTGCRINGGIVDVEHFTDGLDEIQTLIDFDGDEDRIVDIKISLNSKLDAGMHPKNNVPEVRGWH